MLWKNNAIVVLIVMPIWYKISGGNQLYLWLLFLVINVMFTERSFFFLEFRPIDLEVVILLGKDNYSNTLYGSLKLNIWFWNAFKFYLDNFFFWKFQTVIAKYLKQGKLTEKLSISP